MIERLSLLKVPHPGAVSPNTEPEYRKEYTNYKDKCQTLIVFFLILNC